MKAVLSPDSLRKPEVTFQQVREVVGVTLLANPKLGLQV